MNTTSALAISLVVLAAWNSRAEETEVLFDGTAVESWDPMRDQERLKRELAVSELSAVESPPALAWRFVSQGVTFNDLFLRKPVERPFSRLRVLVQNDGEPVQLAAKVRDASGAEWTVPAVALPRGEERWLEFPRDQWQVASWSRDADGNLDYPLAYYRYNSELVAETIGYFAKAVKDLTQRERIVGVFYGYLLQLCGEQRQQNAGHLALERVLASPDVDFLSSPTSYAYRQRLCRR